MTTRVPIRPEILRWAKRRAAMPQAHLARKFPRLQAWEAGEVKPTLKQAQAFARATRTPLGFLFLEDPPALPVPIPDFRTMGGEALHAPSPDLLDTIYVCQRRQEWYRDYARALGEEPRKFVRCASVRSGIVETAARVRSVLGLDIEHRKRLPDKDAAFRQMVDQADDAGILVMVSGVVGSNTRRKLDPDEFRGFALADPLAPLVFVNGADSGSARMFTLAHEIAHLWLGETGLSDVTAMPVRGRAVETWCNQVAAEILAPLSVFQTEYDPAAALAGEAARLARLFKVSTLVVLRRMHDAGGLSSSELDAAYRAEVVRLRGIPRSGGGNYYHTTPARVSSRFARAVITASMEGRTAFTEAFHLLGCRKTSTLMELGRSLGVHV